VAFTKYGHYHIMHYRTHHGKIRQAAIEYLFLAILMLVPPLCVYLDITVLDASRVSEKSITEYTQEFMILASALAFWLGAVRQPGSRGFLLLVAGFFSSMFLREMDSLFDHVFHGFWFWPTLLLAAAVIAHVVMRCRNTVLGPMADFIDTKPFYHIMFGLLVVLVFSRTFASKGFLWNHLEDQNFPHGLKSIMQEGIELMGYGFIAYGAFLFLRGIRENQAPG
jgi:hypothetical protein